MKILKSTAIAAAVMLVVGVVAQPVWGACTTARPLNSQGAYLVSNPDWGGAGGSRICQFEFGCYAQDPDGGAQRPPISANFSGTFWAFGAGDPAIGAGVDNGGWDVSNWSKQRTLGTYYYAAFLTLDLAQDPNPSPGNPPGWGGDPSIDGCITDTGTPGQIDPEECTCILLTDEWDGIGYVAVLSAFSDTGGAFDIVPNTTDGAGAPTIRLTPIGQPSINSSNVVDRDLAVNNFNVQAQALNPASIQQKGCDCGIGYKVYSYRTGRGSLAPTTRSAFCTAPGTPDCWDEAANDTGGSQPVTPINGAKAETIVQVDCDETADEDLYLSTQIVLDPASGGGFSGGNVSQNSFFIECGNAANIAEPNRPDRRQPGRSGDAPRGRDDNRRRGR